MNVRKREKRGIYTLKICGIERELQKIEQYYNDVAEEGANEYLQKNFVKTVKEPGLKGALRSFIHPEKQTFEAVKDLTFEVPKGQILGFIGANGAGKSTTIKMLTGILKPTSGFCRIYGKIP